MTDSFEPRLSSNETRAEAEEVVLPHYSPPVLCPFVSRPFKDCYCASTSSMVVESTILFCGGDFQKCEIYCSYKGNA
ncbi:MAG: hypothetical protein WA610_01390 [Thermodesulfovibrionales bacterium]